MRWAFRLRFNLGETAGLEFSGAEWVLAEGGSGPRVVMRPTDGAESVAQARRLAVVGSGYATQDDAIAAGAEWRDWVTLAFAAINVGADFGDRAPQGGMTEEGLGVVNRDLGIRLLNDVHGLMTYPDDAEVRFVSMGQPTARVSSPHPRLAQHLDTAVASHGELTAQERLAYDLYSASFNEVNADARFVMLMMALETLLDPQPRAVSVQDLVDQMIQLVSAGEIPDNEKRSIEGSLRWLREESISQAGRRLAERLGDRRYMQENPKAFFTRCYGMRSKLVHGHARRPSRDEVSRRAANLERFVGDLISLRLTPEG
jgi:hypothetical protein